MHRSMAVGTPQRHEGFAGEGDFGGRNLKRSSERGRVAACGPRAAGEAASVSGMKAPRGRT